MNPDTVQAMLRVVAVCPVTWRFFTRSGAGGAAIMCPTKMNEKGTSTYNHIRYSIYFHNNNLGFRLGFRLWLGLG